MKRLFLSTKVVTTFLVLLGVSVCSSVGVYTYGVQKEELISYNKFYTDAQEVTHKINLNFEKYDTVLKGLQAFLVVNPDVTHPQFKQYIDSLDIVKNYPGFLSLNHAIYMTSENKDAEIARLKREMQDYLKTNPKLSAAVLKSIENNVQNLGKNKEYFFVRYAEPISSNVFGIGKDLGNKTEMYNALMTTKNTGEAISSGKLFVTNSLADPSKMVKGIGLRLPVYKDMQEKDGYLGTVGASLDFAAVINLAMAEQKVPFHYSISTFDNSKEEIIYTTLGNKKMESKFIHKNSFKVKGKDFIIYLTPENPLHYVSTHQLWIGYAALVFVTLLGIALVFLSLSISKDHAVHLAAAMNKDLQYMAWYDFLTGAMNRAKLLLMIDHRVKNTLDPFKLYFIDLDGFKRVNDTLGHHWGDIVLKEYSARFTALLKDKPQAHFARVGGDEFVVLVDGNEPDEPWIDLINKVTASTFVVNGYKFSLGQSVGIASFPKDGNESETLLRKSDIAMYYAKNSEHSQYMAYSDSFGDVLIERNKMEGELLESVKNNELYLLYQPKMKLVNGRYQICGMEALMRWKNPTWGEVSPLKFIPIAENNGYIEEMSRWLVHEVSKKSVEWNSLYNMEVPISINLSGKQFLNNELAEEVLNIIGSYGVGPSSIILEITESAIMKEPETAQKIIGKFRESGVKVSMDDFGTGYSSFSYLSSFKVDELKIDRSFIRKTQTSSADKSVVEAIIVMAHKLNLTVVAEGVETVEELAFLVENGCDSYQGYHFSKPLREKDLIEFYQKNT